MGKYWHKHFFEQYSHLDSKVGKTLDKERALTTNLDSFKVHLNLFYNIKCKFNVISENIWNTDEKGFTIGLSGVGVLVYCASCHNPSIIQDGGYE